MKQDAPQRGNGPAREMQQKSEPAPSPRAQQQREERSTTGQGQRDSQPQRKETQQKSEPQKQDQRAQDRERDKDRTTGQGQRDSERQRPDAQSKETQKTSDPAQQEQRTQDRAPQRQQDAERQDRDGRAGVQADAQGRVSLNTEQRTRIRQTVLASNAPRVSRVDFSVSVGTVVPRHVTIVDVPPALIEINPAWRGYDYFVVEEEIIIVTPERRIVAVVPVGSGSASGGSATFVDLSPDEIRILQEVLIQRGFSIEVDGVFGPNTREALMTFQRREGLEVTGRIDTRTVSTLGVQGRINVRDDAQGTVGRGSSEQSQQPGRSQAPDATQRQNQQQSGGQPAKESGKEPQGTTGSGSASPSQQGGDMQRKPDASDRNDARAPQSQSAPGGAK
jgi:peptidoglycan hydrolase-like protein with peptidoglycan-binding domain